MGDGDSRLDNSRPTPPRRQASQTVGVNCALLPLLCTLSPHPHSPKTPFYPQPHPNPNPFPLKLKYSILGYTLPPNPHDLSPRPRPSSTPSDFIITISSRHLLSASFSLFPALSSFSPGSRISSHLSYFLTSLRQNSPHTPRLLPRECGHKLLSVNRYLV